MKKEKMNKAIFITVRTGSKRLPNKALLKIKGTTVIEYLIRRLKSSKNADKIILCTTENEQDDVLIELARKNKILFFRGDERDKLDRWRGAAKKYNVEFFVTADGDDIFCEPELIDIAFKQFEDGNCDFIEEKPGQNLPVGAFTSGIKTSALEKVCSIKDSDDTEMMSVYFTELNMFNVEALKNIPVAFRRPDIRMTLDYKEDFDFFKTIIEAFLKDNKKLSLGNILCYLDEHPDIIEINQFRQKDYLANQKARTFIKIRKVNG